MIPLYILGFLLRYGPQHGYQLKKLLEEQASDFTHIKLPTIYYHLEKMEAAGFINAVEDREGVRPEKRVYSILPEGEKRFRELLSEVLELEYRPEFAVDGALYFSDSLEPGELPAALRCHAANMREALERIRVHREQVLPGVPEFMRTSARLIFSHHELHYRAELEWAENAVRELEGGNGNA